MSILLLAPPEEWGRATIERLTAQGDEVRVVEADPARRGRWRSLGARVAPGATDDPDLVERAAQGCRTVVVFVGEGAAPSGEAMLAAAATTVDRWIIVARDAAPATLSELRSHELDYVFLKVPRARRWFRSEPAASSVAEAIDAADDLAGHPRLELDLSDPATFQALGPGSG